MSAPAKDAFTRIDALVNENADDRLPSEIRDELKAATDEKDIEILNTIVETEPDAGGEVW